MEEPSRHASRRPKTRCKPRPVKAATPPSSETAAGLRKKILDLYDHEIDDLRPAAGHKEQRRRVTKQTLDELIRLSQGEA